MDKENMIDSYNDKLCNNKHNKLKIQAATWTNPTEIMMHKRSQKQTAHSASFHLYEVQKQKQILWRLNSDYCWCGGGGGGVRVVCDG